MHTVTLPAPASLKRQAGELLNDYFAQFKQSNILFLASGGSALELVSKIKKGNLGPHVTITVLDERYSHDPTINNFSQLMQTKFYESAINQGCHFVSTQVHENEPITALATRFETGLRVWMQNHPNHIVIATVGIGPDGHTAGIFPYPESPTRFSELFETEGPWITSYNAQGRDPHPLRVTVTVPFLKTVIDYSVIYAVGPNKIGALKRALAPTGTLAETPARIIQSMQHVTLFTDYNETKAKEKPLKL